MRQRKWWVLGLLAAGLAACSSPLPSNICATSITYTTNFTALVSE